MIKYGRELNDAVDTIMKAEPWCCLPQLKEMLINYYTMKISSDEFNDLIMVIKRRIGVDKRNGKTIKYEDIDSYIDKGLEFIPISLTDEDRAEVFAPSKQKKL